LSNGSSLHSSNAIRADTRVSIAGSVVGERHHGDYARSSVNEQDSRVPRKEREKENVMADTGQMVGAWSSFSFTITPEAKKVFDQAFKGFVGVKYTPLAFATQVVAGLNYCFLCQGQVVSPGNPEFAALVYIYAPPGGDPHITGITRISPSAH
jgi:hypothetical protein